MAKKKGAEKGRSADGRFTKGTALAGRPAGVKNKVTSQRSLEARDAFAPINEAALGLMRNHLNFHLAAQKQITEVLTNGRIEDIAILLQLDVAMMHGNCATCRHIFTLSSEYRFGKPTQRVEFDVDDFMARLQEERPELDDEARNLIARRAQEFWRRTA